MPEQLDDAELLRRLDRAMRTVPRQTREIFRAHRLDGLSYRAIAQRTGLPVRDVERHIARATLAIHRALHRRPSRWWERWF
jgi:RNA polymerase sigma-70 factor (ECF subfamily)